MCFGFSGRMVGVCKWWLMEGEMHLTAQCEPTLSAWLDSFAMAPNVSSRMKRFDDYIMMPTMRIHESIASTTSNVIF